MTTAVLDPAKTEDKTQHPMRAGKIDPVRTEERAVTAAAVGPDAEYKIAAKADSGMVIWSSAETHSGNNNKAILEASGGQTG